MNVLWSPTSAGMPPVTPGGGGGCAMAPFRALGRLIKRAWRPDLVVIPLFAVTCFGFGYYVAMVTHH